MCMFGIPIKYLLILDILENFAKSQKELLFSLCYFNPLRILIEILFFSLVEPRNKHGGGDVWNEAIAEQTVSSSEGSSSTPTHQRAQTPKKLRRHKTGVLSPPANNNER